MGKVLREGGIFGKNAFLDNSFCWPQFLQFDFCEPVYCTVRWKPTPKNVSRMARMAGVSPEDPEERMKDEKMPRRGSTALWNYDQLLSSVLWTDATEHDEWLSHFSARFGVFRDKFIFASVEKVFKSHFKILKQRHKIYEIENVGHVVFLFLT